MPSKRAVIFDMDGVLTDSEPFYAEAINVVLAARGLHLTEKDHEAIMGSSIDYTWEWVTRRFQLEGSPQQWMASYDRAVVDILGRKVEPSAGLYPLLDQLEKRNVKLALATSSQLNWALTVLKRLDVHNRFPIVVTTEMVEGAKPAPDIYLLAAKKLRLLPADCVAIEDSPRGIGSAKAAGITTVALRTPSTANLDISAADHVIDTLSQFDLAWLD